MKLKIHSDKRLIKKCLEKDKKAWDRFVDQYSGLIANAVVKTLKQYSIPLDSDLVDDLFQSVFVSLLENDGKKLRQFQWKCRLSSWLHLIAVRITIDHIRRRKTLISLDANDPEGENLHERLRDNHPLADQKLEAVQAKQMFEAMQKNLTHRERLFIKLYYVRELDSKKIANIMNTNTNNIYQLKNVTSQKLKKLAESYKIQAQDPSN